MRRPSGKNDKLLRSGKGAEGDRHPIADRNIGDTVTNGKHNARFLGTHDCGEHGFEEVPALHH